MRWKRRKPREETPSIPLSLGFVPNGSVPTKNFIFKKRIFFGFVFHNRIGQWLHSCEKRKKKLLKEKRIWGLLKPVYPETPMALTSRLIQMIFFALGKITSTSTVRNASARMPRDQDPLPPSAGAHWCWLREEKECIQRGHQMSFEFIGQKAYWENFEDSTLWSVQAVGSRG